MEEIRATWRLAWGLYWRFLLIGFGMTLVIWLILFLIGITALMPLRGAW